MNEREAAVSVTIEGKVWGSVWHAETAVVRDTLREWHHRFYELSLSAIATARADVRGVIEWRRGSLGSLLYAMDDGYRPTLDNLEDISNTIYYELMALDDVAARYHGADSWYGCESARYLGIGAYALPV